MSSHRAGCRWQVLAAASLALLFLGCGGVHRRDAPAHFAGTVKVGAFAGYVWFGRVRSLRASWRVPPVLSRGGGSAATWIGAQSSASRPGDLLLQVGVYEAFLRRPVYAAFWSDTTLHFRLHPLFAVQPGDLITARLRIGSVQCDIEITDETRGISQHVARYEPPGFEEAEWTQEDPTQTKTGRPLPYPGLGEVRFLSTSINGRQLMPAVAYSTWMFASGHYIAPTALRSGSFSLHRAYMTPLRKRYLDIAEREDERKSDFFSTTEGWSTRTPHSTISAHVESFLRAEASDQAHLAATAWPGPARSPIAQEVRAIQEQDKLARLLPNLPAAGRRGWSDRWLQSGQLIALLEKRARDALGVPDIAPN